MNSEVIITVDGKEIKAQKGENLMKTLKENNVFIPSLCYHKYLTPTGACRMCLVKINDGKKLITSCTISIEDGMRIVTTNDEIENIRKTILEQILSEHNYDCPVCSKNGECELQELAYKYEIGVMKNRTMKSIWGKIDNKKDLSSPVLNYDSRKCIKCGRCIKACDEIQGKAVLSFVQRGINTYVNAGFGDWRNSECDGCGECVQSCPTEALIEKPLVERVRAIDVGRRVKTTCGYCGVGCQLDVWVKDDRIVKIKGYDEVPNKGRLCVKGRFGYEFARHPKRLTKPLIKKNGSFVESDWDEALDLVSKTFSQIKTEYGSEALTGLASAKCTNEDNYVFQKFIRSVFGTNSVDHCARLCHAPTVAGLVKAFGSGAMTNSIGELENADCILVTGANVTESHPVTATYIKRAVKKGAKLIIIDPRKIDLVQHSTLWLRQKLGTDVAWINGMIHIIIREGWADNDFIRNRCENFDELKEAVKDFTPERVEEITGISKGDLLSASEIYAKSGKSSIVYAMGITQHITGTDNVLSLANLTMSAGQIGRESTGVNPLRGQNNVQGACDLGALPNVYSGYQKVSDPEMKSKFEKLWNVDELSDKVGLTVVEMMNAILSDKVKGMYIMGENPMLSDPNLRHVEEALNKIDFLVVQDIFLTETAKFADVVLPAVSYLEKEGTFTNSGRRILRVRKAIEPIGETKPDWQITCEIARRMGYDISYESANEIMEEIASVTPIYGGIHYDRLEKEHLQWPCPDREHKGTKFLHKDKFARGRGHFNAVDFIPPAEKSDDEYPFMMTTGRVLYHYHTATMTRKSTPLNEYVKDAYVEMSPYDLNRLNLKDRDRVKVSSRRGEIEIYVKESDRVAPGNLFIPFHFAESPANMLTNDQLDPKSKIPELKVSACRVERI
jgi:formate dehydrogenase alpha subunit